MNKISFEKINAYDDCELFNNDIKLKKSFKENVKTCFKTNKIKEKIISWK